MHLFKISDKYCQELRCPNIITKTRLYTFDPLKPNFYVVKLGFTGVHINFLILLKNIDYGYSLGGSNEY